MKKTPLYEKHLALGGKIIDFGGWALPVQYQGIIQEHETVRNAAGLFDVSHMGELLVEGKDALRNLQMLVTNDLSGVQPGQAIYSPMCTPEGGVVDDLLLYKFGDDSWLLVVNASNTDKDAEWVASHLSGDAAMRNLSEKTAQVAIQGPKAESILWRLTDAPLESIRNYHFLRDVSVAGKKALVSRTGYTGEDGFEIYLDASDAPELWDSLLAAGKEAGLAPAGLGARDTLRFESAMPLYGQELALDITPLEAGLDRFVKLDKADFIGKDALVAQKQRGLARRRAGLEMIGQGVPRSHYEVVRDGQPVGFVTSGGFSPTLRKNLALALITIDCIDARMQLDVVVRGKPLEAVVVKLPFYNRKLHGHNMLRS